MQQLVAAVHAVEQHLQSLVEALQQAMLPQRPYVLQPPVVTVPAVTLRLVSPAVYSGPTQQPAALVTAVQSAQLQPPAVQQQIQSLQRQVSQLQQDVTSSQQQLQHAEYMQDHLAAEVQHWHGQACSRQAQLQQSQQQCDYWLLSCTCGTSGVPSSGQPASRALIMMTRVAASFLQLSLTAVVAAAATLRMTPRLCLWHRPVLAAAAAVAVATPTACLLVSAEKAAAAAPQQSPSAAATVALPRLSALAACPQLVQVSWCSLVMVVCLVCL